MNISWTVRGPCSSPLRFRLCRFGFLASGHMDCMYPGFAGELFEEALEVRLVGVPMLHRLWLLRQFGEHAFEFFWRVLSTALFALLSVLAVVYAGVRAAGRTCRYHAGNSTSQRASGQAGQTHLAEEVSDTFGRSRRRGSRGGALQYRGGQPDGRSRRRPARWHR